MSASHDGFDALVSAREAAWRLGGIPRGGGPVGAKRRRRAHRKIAAFVAREQRCAERCLSALQSFNLTSFERIAARMLDRLDAMVSSAPLAFVGETIRFALASRATIAHALDIAREAADDGPRAWNRVNRGDQVLCARRELATARWLMRRDDT